MADDQGRRAPRRGPMCVFDPSPILTVTVEPGDTCDEIHLHPGGQGVWVARMARRLGADVCLVSALGGETGEFLAPLLSTDGIRVARTDAAGGNGAYVQDRRSGARNLVAECVPTPLSRHEADDLYGTALATAAGAGVVVLAGPRPDGIVPVDFYGRLTADLAALGVPVVADLSGAALTSALDGGMDVLKVSEDDLRRDGFLSGDSHADRLHVLADLHRRGAKAVVLTRADRPAVAFVDGCMVEVRCPALRAVDHRGAGDAMTAAIAVEVGSGSSLLDALRWGAAAGAAAVTRRGLASGRRDEVSALVEFVDIRPYPGSRTSRRPAKTTVTAAPAAYPG